MIDSTGHEAELLCVSGDLTSVASFEPTLTRTVNRFADFRHTAFPRIRSIERFEPGTLAVVSDAIHGVRLSRLLTSISERGIALELGAALSITRQILTALEAFHAHDRDLAHGALGPERIIITSNARVAIADYVLGPALEQLRYSHQHYWKSLRIGLPRSAGVTKFDHSVDILQVGSIALALILGRPLKDDEYSAKLVDVVNTTLGPGAGELIPHKPELRDWLLRSIQCDPHHSFSSATEAGAVLDSMQSDEERAAGMSSLERVLARHHGVAPPPAVVKTTVTAPVVEPLVTPVVKPPVMQTPVVQAPVVHAPIEPPIPPIPAPQVATFKPIAPQFPVEPTPSAPPALKPVVAAAPIEPPAPPPFVKPIVAPPPEPLVLVPLAGNIDPPPPAPAFPVAASSMHSSRSSKPSASRRWQHIAAAVVIVAGLMTGGMFVWRRSLLASGVAAPSGTLTVQSNPSGARLEIDGKPSGFTPTTLSVQQGTHTIVLRGSGEPKTMTVSVAAGAQVSQYIEFARSVATTGGLIVRTEPAGALVTVDGVKRGASPATIAELAPGEHTVVVSADGTSVDQNVMVEAGVTASLVVPLSARDKSLLSGWIAVSAPIDVQIFEDGKLLGTNQTDRVMVSAGEHHLDFVNETLGYRGTRKVSVSPGKVDNISLKLPSGSISVNAVPWAEVFVDGEKAGDTPIGNVQATIGKHDVVFRNPDFGEMRQSVMVTLLGPARLSVDMRKK